MGKGRSAACCGEAWTADYFCSPATLDLLRQQASRHGVLLAGAVFAAGWWCWVDACVLATPHTIPFQQYLPGILATLCICMINVIRREELQESDPFDDAGFCRPRAWLFLSYCMSFGSIVGAVWVMIEHYANNEELTSAAEKWPGVAGIFQVVLVLASGLLLFVSRAPSEDAADMGYGSF
eukprot:CAMPEP_0119107662 /NCGR_PEP_ID=MMETSP1180-20130426/11529_1 /TAXON_ID=3052 ORGANISM="Chlamydomonas cf sp, Strain CCMP681" /NCGR_SAMPLE_ID=MMETSP1180 /ASSEMBLY_ACC=CAM_ASM_000741 /LENGTH=179 /DNA_ID=CAMNT_0007093181 /DNA_START=11 /DNA_END=550 /DNA_ORIENTATION=-